MWCSQTLNRLPSRCVRRGAESLRILPRVIMETTGPERGVVGQICLAVACILLSGGHLVGILVGGV